MNQKASYEITITEKLRQLQAPDMRAAIWGRIQDQLDNDMPDDDHHPDDPDTTDKGGWRSTAWKVGPLAVIVAIITIFFINKNNRSTQSNKTQKQPVNTETVTPINTTSGSPPSGKKTNGKSSMENKTANAPVQGSDSLFDQPLINAPLPDSSSKPIFTNPAVQQSSQSPPGKPEVIPKRSRGVKGISDKDYHISLKKDSVP